MLVVIALVGILGAIAAPSFGSLLDSIKVDQTVTELRTVFQDTQRHAIRTSQVCVVQVPTNNNTGPSSLPQWWLDLLAKFFPSSGSGSGQKTITGNCLTSGSPQLSEDVDLASNVQAVKSSSNSSSGRILIQFGALGSADFSIASAVQPPAIPSDPTGKVVAFIADKPGVKKKCVAISGTLGLTRVGTYTGGTTPADITDRGVCTALDWKRQ